MLTSDKAMEAILQKLRETKGGKITARDRQALRSGFGLEKKVTMNVFKSALGKLAFEDHLIKVERGKRTHITNSSRSITVELL